MRFLLAISCLTLTLSLSQAGEAKSSNVAPPTFPPPRSRVDVFRELLDMKPAEREQALAKKSATARKIIEERLKEFDALSPDQRKTRLRLMELQSELLPLLQATPSTRGTMMAVVPEQDRSLIQERLRIWDTKLSPDLQKLILENEMVLHYFITGEATTQDNLTNSVSKVSPQVRTNMLTNIQRWRQLTPDQQRQAFDAFREIFGLPDKERDKALLNSLQGQPDRDQIENFVKSFEKLPASEREKRMDAFQRFSSMTLDQRVRFMQNAERWEAMPESDKQALRTILKTAPPIPPLPPGFFSGVTNAAYR